MRIAGWIGALLGAVAALPLGTAAQSAPTRRIAAPTVVFTASFSGVADVREQSDGQVMVLDRSEGRILRLDPSSGRSVALSRSGMGPGEYVSPQRLLALPGDTTLVLDMVGRGRAVMITRDGVATTMIRAKGIEQTAPLFMGTDVLTDARGRLYELAERVRVQGGRAMRTDSSAVRRLDRVSGRADTLATYSRKLRSPLGRSPSGAAGSAAASASDAARAGGPPPPYASVDQWSVAPDGRIAIAGVDPYRVTYILPDGSVGAAADIAYDPIPLREQHRTAWRERMRRPVPAVMFGPNGQMTGGRSTPRYIEPREWPDLLPAFGMRALRFAPDGTLWVERELGGDEPQTFDLIDRTARRVARVEMPPRTRLVGFGVRSLYLVKISTDDELETLQRHPMP